MSLYIIVGVLLLLGTIHEVVNQKANNVLYTIFFLGLVLMLIFRYGQGTDYFGYQYIFEKTPFTFDLKTLNESSMHSEIGWKLLCVLFRKLGLSYQLFVGFIGIVTMLFLNSFIQKYCSLKVTALLIAYPTLYLTYICSGMRQGLAICIFLGVMLDLYLKNKKGKFLLAVFLCSTIHTASWILLILLFDWIKDFVRDNEYIIVLLAWIIGICFSFFGFRIEIFDRTFSNESTGISYIAAVERILTYIVIQILYDKYKTACGENTFLETIMFIYSISTIFYGIFFSMPNISSRICYFFKATELSICTTLMSGDKEKYPEYSTIFFYIAALSMVMLIKNIDSYLVQGQYFDYITVWNYPYNNVFVKGEYYYNYYQQLLK